MMPAPTVIQGANLTPTMTNGRWTNGARNENTQAESQETNGTQPGLKRVSDTVLCNNKYIRRSKYALPETF